MKTIVKTKFAKSLREFPDLNKVTDIRTQEELKILKVNGMYYIAEADLIDQYTDLAVNILSGHTKTSTNSFNWVYSGELPRNLNNTEKNKTFKLAERLADEAFGSKGVIEYSNRQKLTVKFYEMLKEPSAEFYSKAVICAERYKQAAKAEEDLTAAFEALVKNHNEIKERERTIK